jgi:2-dehydro-3-deoxyphosphogluconate aldolase/(4S)-4-hydroxy-2-oxoglutarate aldolase
LAGAGLPTVEVTLRTPAALEALERIAAEVPEAVVGAGTVVHAAQVEEAVAAGARFLVTPGTTPALLDALEASGLPFLPGAATASEIVALLERGVAAAKLFPAEAIGGVAAVRAFAGPFPEVRLCPTGGIDQQAAGAYLAQPNVACVGGSWMLPRAAVRAGDWETVAALARAAARLRAEPPRAVLAAGA